MAWVLVGAGVGVEAEVAVVVREWAWLAWTRRLVDDRTRTDLGPRNS